MAPGIHTRRVRFILGLLEYYYHLGKSDENGHKDTSASHLESDVLGRESAGVRVIKIAHAFAELELHSVVARDRELAAMGTLL